jgi:hypothetical protein
MATMLAAAVALLVPAVAGAQQGGNGNGNGSQAGNGGERGERPYEREYLDVRRDFVADFGRKEAGRNIVRHGYNDPDEGVRDARRGEVIRSTERMRDAIAPAAAPASERTAPAEPAAAPSTAGAPTSVIECESGGDYGAVNPAGYYGAYQFDQQTWDAYAPDGYAGTNPAQAPPAVQDAAAAGVDYDAWPNC